MNRMDVVNSEIQKAISEIVTYELSNPKITGIITVTRVETTSDLDYCKVFLSIFPDENKTEVFNQIKHSAGYIRKILCQKIEIRQVPFLTFFLDNGLQQHAEIDNLIAQTKIKR